MSQTMSMVGMGGPVGGGPGAGVPQTQQQQQAQHAQQQQQQQQQMNAGTPTNVTMVTTSENIKRLNTYIYDYFLRSAHYDVARKLYNDLPIDTRPTVKESPDTRNNNQANGVDDDGDTKDGIKDRPSDLPAPMLPPNPSDTPFLQDWWCQFWDIYWGHRGRGKPNAMAYIQAQRQKMARTGAGMDPSMANMRAQYGMQMNVMNGMGPQQDMKKVAMQRNITQQQLQAAQQAQRSQQMPGQEMQRSGSQMDLGGPRSGSPNPGDAPSSPKRPRTDGNFQPMGPGRPGQQVNNVGLSPSDIPTSTTLHTPDPIAANQTREILRSHGLDPDSIPAQAFNNLTTQSASIQNKTIGEYKFSMTKQAALTANANLTKSMPPNAATVAAMGGPPQGSPMSNPGMDGVTADFYNNSMRSMPPNPPQGAGGPGQGQNGGNHALQDYQMQLMLLEQQNKKRLLMARQEQDNAHTGGMQGPNGGPNGGLNGAQFVPGASPQARQPGQSPGPGDMQRATPKMGTSPGNMPGRQSPNPLDPNMGPALRQQLMVQQNGIVGRPPSSHPAAMMTAQQMQQMQQMEFMARQSQGQMMPNGTFGGPGAGPPPGQMMPGQAGPNQTPRQGNMPPPPAPSAGNSSATQPSSPPQTAAPPTPSQANKPKPGTKKDNKANKTAVANKKGGNVTATPAPESEQPPTPTPQTPMTPMHQNSFGQGKQLPNGAPTSQPNQPNQSSQQPAAPAVQPSAPDAGGDFGMNQFGDMDMSFGADNGDLLVDFDFDSFLNTGDGSLGPEFDAGIMFGGDGGIEAGDGMGQ